MYTVCTFSDVLPALFSLRVPLPSPSQNLSHVATGMSRERLVWWSCDSRERDEPGRWMGGDSALEELAPIVDCIYTQYIILYNVQVS